MNGLREKKKKKRQERIFLSAIHLFNSKGYSQTTMKDIAEKAQLGVGTLYNYFSSKSDLLLEIMEQKLDHMVKESQNFTQDLLDSEKNGAAVLKEFMNYYLNYFFLLNKDKWSEAFLEIFSSSSYIQKGVRMDLRIIEQIKSLLNKLKNKRMIAQDVNVDAASFVFYSILGFQFMGYVMFPGMKKNQLYQYICNQIDLIYKGIKP